MTEENKKEDETNQTEQVQETEKEKDEIVPKTKDKEYANEEISKLDNFKSIEDMLGLANTLIKSNLVPKTLNTPEKVVTVMQQGRELGLGPVTALNNINNIQGKVTLSVHAYTALARAKANVDWEMVKDCHYIFPDGFESPTTNKALVEDHGGQAQDKICTIKFYRYNKKLDRVMTNTLSYTIGEAAKQGLMEKDNWQRMPNQMLRARTLSLGIRFVASDTFMGGLYDVTEILDAEGKRYDVDKEGEVTILD